MADKFRRSEPLNITFTNGEQPPAAKLRAMVVQSRNGSQLLEKAIGDLWNQSGDPYMVAFPLQINNIGRTIGQVRYLNPAIYRTSQPFTYRDSIGTLNTGRNEGYTQLKPSSGIAIVGGSTAISNIVASESLIASAGDIWVDIATGRFKSYSALTVNDKLDYVVDSSEWSAGFEQIPSIIPDPRQITYTACRVLQVSTNFFIYMPPRRPLALTGAEKPERYPSSTDYTANEATSTSLPRKLWQSGGVSALADEHYRYSLSKEVRDILAGLNIGDPIPQGLVQLYDQTQQTIIEDCIFKKTATPYMFQISSNSVDFTSKATASETEANYNSTGYSIITTGTSLSRAIFGLTKAIQGKANNSGTFASIIDHGDLRYFNPSSSGANYPATGFTAWTPSRWGSGDEHTSLLSRVGSFGTSSSKHRDVNDNAMLGDLLMGSSVAASGNFINITSDSRKICFGSTASGPSIRYAQAINGLDIIGANGIGAALRINPGTGNQLGILAYGSGTSAAGSFTGSSAGGNGILVNGGTGGTGASIIGGGGATAGVGAFILGGSTSGGSVGGVGLNITGGSSTSGIGGLGLQVTAGTNGAIGGTAPGAINANGGNAGVSGTPGNAITGTGGTSTNGAVSGGTGVLGVGGIGVSNNGGAGVQGIGTGTNAGILGSSSGTGAGGIFTGSANRGAINLVNQTQPSAPVSGDAWSVSGTGLWYYDGTSSRRVDGLLGRTVNSAASTANTTINTDFSNGTITGLPTPLVGTVWEVEALLTGTAVTTSQVTEYSIRTQAVGGGVGTWRATITSAAAYAFHMKWIIVFRSATSAVATGFIQNLTSNVVTFADQSSTFTYTSLTPDRIVLATGTPNGITAGTTCQFLSVEAK